VHQPYRIIQTYLILNKEDGLLDDLATWVSPKVSVAHLTNPARDSSQRSELVLTFSPSSTIQDSAQCAPAALIRFAAHLALFIRQVKGACLHADELIEAYVKLLIKTRQTALVALYTYLLPANLTAFLLFVLFVAVPASGPTEPWMCRAKLPAEDQVEIYANFLRDISQREEVRTECLALNR
jgi:hypothetical protein